MPLIERLNVVLPHARRIRVVRRHLHHVGVILDVIAIGVLENEEQVFAGAVLADAAHDFDATRL